MSYCKIALFLAFVSLAIASVSCTRCYACDTSAGSDQQACSQPLNPQSPLQGDCSTLWKNQECVKITYVHRNTGHAGIARSCIEAGYTCEDITKTYNAFDKDVTDCKTCRGDLCNGE